jgi:hypothetical protein
MKDIPGYEIVEGGCDDCDLADTPLGCTYEYIKQFNIPYQRCKLNKIYKKKEEKTMTRDEMIAVIQAHKEGKIIHVAGFETTRTQELYNPSLTGIINLMSNGTTLVVKPEPKVIPWTADDWRKFICISIADKYGTTIGVHSWTEKGIFWGTHRDFITYKDLVRRKNINGKPCGKVVEE